MADREKMAAFVRIFQTMAENLRNFKDQLSIVEETDTSNTNFNPQQFWERTLQIADKLGYETNKITILWISDPLPTPEDMHSVCGSLELACVALMNMFHSFPSAQGRMVKSKLKNGVGDILDNCSRFTAVLLKSIGVKYNKDSHPLVSECGMVTAECERLNQLPRDNRSACILHLRAEANIIKDALREIEEARTNEGFLDEFECDESWTEADNLIIQPLLGMIKTSGALTKKTLDAVKELKDENQTKFDDVIHQFSRISPLVDDLSLTIYPPLVWEEAKEAAWKLKQTLEEILVHLTRLIQEEGIDISWLEFINKAVAHNAAEIQRVFIQHGLAELSLS